LICTKTCAGGLNDLFVLDPLNLEWRDLTNIATGAFPSPRAGLGMTSVPGRIFVFGGFKPVEGG